MYFFDVILHHVHCVFSNLFPSIFSWAKKMGNGGREPNWGGYISDFHPHVLPPSFRALCFFSFRNYFWFGREKVNCFFYTSEKKDVQNGWKFPVFKPTPS